MDQRKAAHTVMLHSVLVGNVPLTADIVRNARKTLNVRIPDRFATPGNIVTYLKQTNRNDKLYSNVELHISRTY